MIIKFLFFLIFKIIIKPFIHILFIVGDLYHLFQFVSCCYIFDFYEFVEYLKINLMINNFPFAQKTMKILATLFII